MLYRILQILVGLSATNLVGAKLFLHRYHGGCPVHGRVVCQTGEVTVIADDQNQRLLRFGDECATESRVHCQGPLPFAAGTCDGGCHECPCEFSAAEGLSASYMQTMFDQLQPLCRADSGPSRVLMVGLGGGELPQFLLHRCPAMSVEVVELNPAVIDAARRFFGVAASESLAVGSAEGSKSGQARMLVEQMDAEAAVAKRRQAASVGEYDAVLIDCFAGHGRVPETCRSRRLADDVKGILRPGGMLLQNIWDFSPDHPEVAQGYTDTVKLYGEVFSDNLSVIDVPMPANIAWVKVLRGELTPFG
mmetsp:Transcript_22814/g.53295  ORF Transcript_22814/g.53295 Transcript_22814/m.53295 type:complete len:305 (+) Transcript_22814:54-968(+)